MSSDGKLAMGHGGGGVSSTTGGAPLMDSVENEMISSEVVGRPAGPELLEESTTEVVAGCAFDVK